MDPDSGGTCPTETRVLTVGLCARCRSGPVRPHRLLWAGCRSGPVPSERTRRYAAYMKKAVPVEDASALIDEKIRELRDWRGKTLARVREIIHEADPAIVEEWKWRTPVWSRNGIVCTGETYKNSVKMTFAKGAGLKDPTGLFNSSLDGKVRRAIDIFEGDKVDVEALKDLIRSAVALNLKGIKSKPKPRSVRGQV